MPARPTLAASSFLVALALAGTLAAMAWDILALPFRLGELVALLALAGGVASVGALALPLPRAALARMVATGGGAMLVFAFFAAPVAGGPALAGAPPLALVAGAPAAGALIAGGGSGYLARSVRKARLRRIPVLAQRP